jgi:hypothetical protein
MNRWFIGALLLATTLVACPNPNPNPSPTISSVVVSANPTSINTNATSALSAVVSGTGAFGNGVTWSIVSGGGVLSNQTATSATFTAAAQAGSTIIKATSVQDSSKSGTVTITTVQPSGDTTPPKIASTIALTKTSVEVTFNEALAPASISAAQFSFPVSDITATNAVLSATNATKVIVTTTAQTTGTSYAVLVNNNASQPKVTDVAGNAHVSGDGVTNFSASFDGL